MTTTTTTELDPKKVDSKKYIQPSRERDEHEKVEKGENNDEHGDDDGEKGEKGETRRRR